MSNIYETLRAEFANLRPGAVTVIGDYVGRPKTSTWFFIEDLDQMRLMFKRRGMSFTPRFRGPRQTVYNISRINGRQYHRSKMTRQATCLKAEAMFFTVSTVKSY